MKQQNVVVLTSINRVNGTIMNNGPSPNGNALVEALKSKSSSTVGETTDIPPNCRSVKVESLKGAAGI